MLKNKNLILVLIILAIVVAVGVYKFEYIANQFGYDANLNRLEVVNTTDNNRETIYFSEVFKKWQDNIGDCNTCTPENGFSADGVVENIAWRELWLSLKNDANVNPPIEEVKELFKTQYAEESGYYPVRVHNLKGQFIVHIAVPKELKNIDFFDRKGALLATYDVIQYDWDTTSFMRHSSIDSKADENKARAYAEQTEIYVQDGHSLKLREPQLLNCASCFDFVFDHYGDPNVPYYISVRVNDDGSIEDITEK